MRTEQYKNRGGVGGFPIPLLSGPLQSVPLFLVIKQPNVFQTEIEVALLQRQVAVYRLNIHTHVSMTRSTALPVYLEHQRPPYFHKNAVPAQSNLFPGGKKKKHTRKTPLHFNYAKYVPPTPTQHKPKTTRLLL